MINADSVTVMAERYGRVCVLRIGGELDTVTAAGFAAWASSGL